MINTSYVDKNLFLNESEDFEPRYNKAAKEYLSDVELKELNDKMKKLSDLDDKSKLKDPNFIVKTIRWFRGLYFKIMAKRLPDSEGNIEKNGFLNRLLGRILKFVDKLLNKLQKLVDRRTYEQISNKEKFDSFMDDVINDSDKEGISKDVLNKYFDSKSNYKYRFTGDARFLINNN